MIAGQQAQAAGVDGNALMNSELGGKIRQAIAVGQDLFRRGHVRIGLLKPGARGEIMFQALHHPVHVRQKAVVAQQFLQALLLDSAKELDRAVVAAIVALVVDAAKKGDGFVVPAPPQVISKLLEGRQTARKMG